jgi:hypothetical protein
MMDTLLRSSLSYGGQVALLALQNCELRRSSCKSDLVQRVRQNNTTGKSVQKSVHPFAQKYSA